jgi:PEGA domain
VSARQLLAAIGLVLLLAWPARADDRDDAKREFAAGQAADKHQDWQGALEHYLAAYEKLAHPFALYNIGNDYEQLNNLREAAHYYQRYVDASPDSADRERVTKLLAELKTRPSKVIIRSIPGGASVSIDDKPAGNAPYTASLRGGVHHVIVEQNGLVQEQDVTVEFGEPQDITLKLAGGGNNRRNFVPPPPGGPTGTIMVRGTPSGARVTIDELAAGVTPVAVPVTPGAHQVRVTQFGYQDFDQTAIVTPGMVTEVDAPLQRGSGALGNGPMIQLGYLVGLDGGADVRGAGALVEFEFGFRVSSYEGIIGIGKLGSTTAVDLGIRWNVLSGRFTPFLGAGYTFIDGGAGYELAGGLRLDFARTESYGFSLLATASARFVDITTTDSTGASISGSGVIVPITLSLIATKFR